VRFHRRIVKYIQEMRLKQKLISSYLIALIVPLLIISLTIYHLSAKSMEKSSIQFASMYSSQAITTIDDFMAEYDQLTKSVLVESEIIRILQNSHPMNMEQLIQNKETVRRFLVRMMTLKPEIQSVMLIGANDAVYYYSKTSTSIDDSKLLEQPWLEQNKNGVENLFISTVHDRSYYTDGGEGAVFTVGRKLLNYSGSYAGIILMDLDPQDLLRLNEDFLLARNQYDIRLVITKIDGGIIYHSDAITNQRKWDEIIGGEYVAKQQEAEDELIVLSDESKRGDILLRTEIPLNKLLENINHIKKVTLAASLGCIVFIVMISVLFSHRISKPILALRRSMKMAESGHYAPISLNTPSNGEIGGLVLSYNYMILKIKELIEVVFITEIKQKQAKFLALQTQINPHMLFNTLESIRMKALVNNQDEVADMIKILARLFRLSLGNKAGIHTIRDEVEYVTNYIKLQNIRYDDRFALELKLTMEMLDSPIFPVIFQPIVENSIAHGFRNHNSKLHICIDGEVTEKGMLIRITDNGAALASKMINELNDMLESVRLDPNRIQEENSEKGIGLKNIAERIKLHYGEAYGLKLKRCAEKGLVVEILIPKP